MTLQSMSFDSFLCRLSDEVGPLSLGFCFSLPAEQTAIDKGTIARLTKKFTNPGAVGADPVELLRDAISRTGHKVTGTVDLYVRPYLTRMRLLVPSCQLSTRSLSGPDTLECSSWCERC